MQNLYLNYEGFDDYLVARKPFLNGIRYLFRFENGYGASVIKNAFSYGSKQDLWELAVIKYRNDRSYRLCYDTEITGDVEGCLTNDDVLELLHRIKDLSR